MLRLLWSQIAVKFLENANGILYCSETLYNICKIASLARARPKKLVDKTNPSNDIFLVATHSISNR